MTMTTTSPAQGRSASTTDWPDAVRQAAARHTDAWVRAEPFRAHVRGVLADTGLHWRVLAVAARVPPRVVHTLLFGRAGRPCRRIRALDAASLLLFTAASAHQLAHTPAPPGAARACLRLLDRSGHDADEVAAWLGASPAHVHRLRDADLPGSCLDVARLVAACTALGLEGARAWLPVPPETAGMPRDHRLPTSEPVSIAPGGPGLLSDWAA